MSRKLLILLALIQATAWGAPRDSFLNSAGPDRSYSRHLHQAAQSLDEDSLHQYDATRILAELEFDLDNSELWGDVTIELRADEIELSRIDFRFTSSLNIDSLWSESVEIESYEQLAGDSLLIQLASPLAVGDSADFHVRYSGSPEIVDAWGGIRFHSAAGWRPPIVFSMGDGLNLEPPPANYTWLPSYADPSDKLLWEAYLTAPSDLVAVSGGSLIDTVQHDSTTTWHYRLDQPVSTYLIFISVSDYEIQVQREENPRIENYVYPSRVVQAETHFSNVPAVLDGFAELFGPYPFDRFGFNMTRIGDMEHATCVSHSDQLVTANHTYDWLLFHELSHMWWGDWVTIGDWRDLWLNEGMASYCEALGMEILGGSEAYHNYVTNNLMPAARISPVFPIYDPQNYWSSTVYEKGGCVMHMLRWVMGDSLFFEALQDYGQQFAYSNAVTTDFQAVLESHYGETLQWFFDPWIYEGTRYPRYEVTSIFEIDIYNHTIQQIQPGSTFFRMPIEIRGYVPPSPNFVVDTVWVEASGEVQYFDYDAPEWFGIDSVVIDPNNWILKQATYLHVVSAESNPDIALSFEISGLYPNPFNPSTTINYDLPATSPVALTVYNLQGQKVTTMNLGQQTAGSHSVNWDGSDFASGIYIFKLSTHNSMRTAKAILLK